MKIITSNIPDVLIFEPTVYIDDRGYFMETWRQSFFDERGLDTTFVQENHSKSNRGTLRGLHYQLRHPQGKLARVISGKVFDVAVDLRKSSAHFCQWIGVVLSAENKKQVWIPPGFAHGFYVISESAELLYKCTEYYHPEHDRNLLWNDERLAIEWPLILSAPILSVRDQHASPFSKADLYSGTHAHSGTVLLVCST